MHVKYEYSIAARCSPCVLGLNLTDSLINRLVRTDVDQDSLETAGFAETFQRLGCLVGFFLASYTGQDVVVCMVEELRGELEADSGVACDRR